MYLIYTYYNLCSVQYYYIYMDWVIQQANIWQNIEIDARCEQMSILILRNWCACIPFLCSGSVLVNVLFGVAFWANIHSIGYFIVVQVRKSNFGTLCSHHHVCLSSVYLLPHPIILLFTSQLFPSLLPSFPFPSPQLAGGALQSTGWPGVVAVMSNWFGKGKWVSR